MAAVSRRLAIIRLRQICKAGFEPILSFWLTNLGTGTNVMARQADHYRAKAVECDKSANSTDDSYIKSQFEDLARQWRELAEHADKAGR
jgi:hypothetical protein